MERHLLFGVLNWGLGHAVRSVPVIRELLLQKCEVIICGNGKSLQFLKIEFPNLICIEIPGLEVKYSEKGFGLLSAFGIIPKLVWVHFAEMKAIRDIIHTYSITHLIADHRYGFRCNKIPSAIIIHQINFKLPRGFQIFQSIILKLNYFMLKKFDEVWIPDLKGIFSISGKLSEINTNKILDVKYLGILNSLKSEIQQNAKQFDVLLICSGPEPWRTVFEQRAYCQLQNSGLMYLVVRGITDESLTKLKNAINYANREALGSLISSAKLVVSLAGYTSLCDYYSNRVKALIIPTPGQPEQEYLAKRQKSFNYFQVQNFENLNIIEAFTNLDAIQIPEMQNSSETLRSVILSFLDKN